MLSKTLLETPGPPSNPLGAEGTRTAKDEQMFAELVLPKLQGGDTTPVTTRAVWPRLSSERVGVALLGLREACDCGHPSGESWGDDCAL